MNAERILAMLYEMALVIGGEIRLDPLCTKTLQRLLFHTSFPCGMVLLNTVEPAFTESGNDVAMRLEKAIGDFALSKHVNSTLSIPASLVNGKVELTEAPEILDCLPCRKGHYRVFLRLPFGAIGTILLLAPHLPASNLPLTEVFQPILGNFAKAFLLCQNNEAYTQQIEVELRSRSVAIDQSPASVVITDLAPRIQYVNPHFCRVTGYSAEEVLGRNPRVFKSGLTENIIYEEMWSTLLQGNAWSGEFINKRKNGELYWEEAHIAPVLDTRGLATHYVAVKLDVTERKQADAQIRRSLQEKEVLLKEIHHRVKNNLQIISSLFNLQLSHCSNPDLAPILLDSQNRIKTMALIHEKLYRTDNLAVIEFGGYLRELTQALVRSFRSSSGQVHVVVAADDINFGIDTAVPCGLLVNELVTNALKHAFPDGRPGQIQVDLRENADNTLTLCVTDTGIGLSEDFDLKLTTTLGMKLIQALIMQLQGILEIRQDHGTLFKVTFQKQEHE